MNFFSFGSSPAHATDYYGKFYDFTSTASRIAHTYTYLWSFRC